MVYDSEEPMKKYESAKRLARMEREEGPKNKKVEKKTKDGRPTSQVKFGVRFDLGEKLDTIEKNKWNEWINVDNLALYSLENGEKKDGIDSYEILCK